MSKIEIDESKCGSIKNSIDFWNTKSFTDYKEWLDNQIKLNDKSSIFLYKHIKNFLNYYQSSLGYDQFIFKEKLFYIDLEFKNLQEAKTLLMEMESTLGSDKKFTKMHAELEEIDTNPDPSISIDAYKHLAITDQNDRESIKRYIMLMKTTLKMEPQSIKDYITQWNEFLKNYMDDEDGWNELAQCYLLTNNYQQAIYCLEELLLHNPNNYKVLIKIGDIENSIGFVDNYKNALKYYSRAILIKPTPKAFWGIAHSISNIYKIEKKLNDKMKNLVKICKNEISNLYAKSPFGKITLDMFYNLPDK